jgi:hypothetical protein
MPGPFSALSKASKIDIAKDLDQTIELPDGRIVKKKDVVEFEIEKRLGNDNYQSDIMKALKKQGIDVSANYIKERVAVARRRNPKLKPDPRFAKMEANWIIQNGMSQGKGWDEISQSLLDAGFNGPKLTEIARNKYSKMMQQQGTPAVIDTGESGPNAGPEQPPYADPTNPVRELKDFMDMDDAGLAEVLKKVGDEALRRKKAQIQGLREKGAQKAEQFDWSQLEELGRMWAENPDFGNAKASEGQDFVEHNLDVPVEQPGLKGPVEPEFRNR